MAVSSRPAVAAARRSALSTTLVLSALLLLFLLALQPIPSAAAADADTNTDGIDACSALPDPTTLTDAPCQIFSTWDDFASHLPTARGTLLLCAGSVLTRPAADAPHAIIKNNLRLACSVPGRCRIRGPGRHLTIKTRSNKRAVIDGIHFEGGDFTSVVVVDDAAGQHTFCGNTFASNSRPVDSHKGGGAIYAGRNTNLVIGGGSVFRNNAARWGGAISFAGTSLTILDSSFVDNVAGEGGSAIEATPALMPVTVTTTEAATTTTTTTASTVSLPQRIEVGNTAFIDSSNKGLDSGGGGSDGGQGGAAAVLLVASGEEWVDLGGNTFSTTSSNVDGSADNANDDGSGCDGAYARSVSGCLPFVGDGGGQDILPDDPQGPEDSHDSHDDDPATYEEEAEAAQEQALAQEEEEEEEETGTPAPPPPPRPVIFTGLTEDIISGGGHFGLCQGDCDVDSDCATGLTCYQRSSGESVPGCLGGSEDRSDVDYCVGTGPTDPATGSYNNNNYGPVLTNGKGLTRDSATGLYVADGLTVRRFAKMFEPVSFTSTAANRRGRQLAHSGQCAFPYRPDGAATFSDARHNVPGGFHYCVNSESKYSGGVYCVEFDADCHPMDFAKGIGGRADDFCTEPLGGFVPNRWNCSGGKTPWNTWVTCEELDVDDYGGGYCWQVSPYNERPPERISAIGRGEWEAMAADDRTSVPVFFFTEDWSQGALRRFEPAASSLPAGWQTLHGDGDLTFLVFDNVSYDNGNNMMGRFSWTSNIKDGRKSQQQHFPNLEGIVFMHIDGDPLLFFVSKGRRRLYKLNLDTFTFTSTRTQSNVLTDGGSFQNDPDQLLPVGKHFMYHTEEGGGTPGVYFKDLRSGQYRTIFQDEVKNEEETTGLAISPSGKCLLSCLQDRGECFVFEREDGLNFEDLAPSLRIR